MQIGGFRIRVTGAATRQVRAANSRPLLKSGGTASSDSAHLSWLLLDPEPEPCLPAQLAESVINGSYLIPSPEVSRSLVDDHVRIRG